MASWKFEIANWYSADAKEVARNVKDVQLAAMDKSEDGDQADYDLITKCLDAFLSNLGTPADAAVYLNVQSDTGEDGSRTLNIGIRVIPTTGGKDG